MTESKGAKISVYVDEGMREGLSLLASMERQSVTALVRKIIQEYLIAHAADIDFMRNQEKEIREYRERRSNNDG
ncbi:MAG: ribbon-helix-helix protein, CopG family [Synergistaceae bacterium]|nr:ribbon-helix-helix protein, CopG family [Synergistaceae bacterium]